MIRVNHLLTKDFSIAYSGVLIISDNDFFLWQRLHKNWIPLTCNITTERKSPSVYIKMMNKIEAYVVGSIWARRVPSLNLCNYCLINSIKKVSKKRNIFIAESGL